MTTENNTTTLQPTAFPFDGLALRTVQIDGQPWFFAADICAALELDNVPQAVVKLDDDERRIITSDTSLGPRQMNVVNESGLYHLIFKSRKKNAQIFRKWVTAEVLPALRTKGTYSITPAAQSPAVTTPPPLDPRCVPVAHFNALVDQINERHTFYDQVLKGISETLTSFIARLFGLERRLGIQPQEPTQKINRIGG